MYIDTKISTDTNVEIDIDVDIDVDLVLCREGGPRAAMFVSVYDSGGMLRGMLHGMLRGYASQH